MFNRWSVLKEFEFLLTAGYISTNEILLILQFLTNIYHHWLFHQPSSPLEPAYISCYSSLSAPVVFDAENIYRRAIVTYNLGSQFMTLDPKAA